MLEGHESGVDRCWWRFLIQGKRDAGQKVGGREGIQSASLRRSHQRTLRRPFCSLGDQLIAVDYTHLTLKQDLVRDRTPNISAWLLINFSASH